MTFYQAKKKKERNEIWRWNCYVSISWDFTPVLVFRYANKFDYNQNWAKKR